jgi:hypothetical protein
MWSDQLNTSNARAPSEGDDEICRKKLSIHNYDLLPSLMTHIIFSQDRAFILT